MDLQKILNNAVAAKRAEDMKTSAQLTLGELILKMEGKSADKPVVFDDGKHFPTYLGSWRGSYCELALGYNEYETEKPMNGAEFSEKLKEAVGKTYTGYKGGDFLMGKTTPVWVANYGESMGFREETEDGHNTAIVDIVETDDAIVLQTFNTRY